VLKGFRELRQDLSYRGAEAPREIVEADTVIVAVCEHCISFSTAMHCRIPFSRCRLLCSPRASSAFSLSFFGDIGLS